MHISVLTLARRSALLPGLLLLLLSRLSCLLFEPAREAGGARVAFDDRGGHLGNVTHLRHGSVTHGVLGVLQAAAFEEYVLSDTHPCLGGSDGR